MTIRRQQQDDKHPFVSPTTPGLYITLQAYIIELVCLNVNKKIGPRFWSDTRYWSPKFRRETKGVFNVGQLIDMTDTLTQTALIQIIKEYNIKSLTSKTTVAKVVKHTRKRKIALEEQRTSLSEQKPQQEIDSKKNSTFVDVGNKGKLAKIRESEDNTNAKEKT